MCVCVCVGGGGGNGFGPFVEDHKKPGLNGVKRQINEAGGSITGDAWQKGPVASFVWQNR